MCISFHVKLHVRPSRHVCWQDCASDENSSLSQRVLTKRLKIKLQAQRIIILLVLLRMTAKLCLPSEKNKKMPSVHRVQQWRIRITTVTETQQQFPSYFCRLTCSCEQEKSVSVAVEMQQWVPFDCCRATKYFVLLSTIKYTELFLYNVRYFCPILTKFRVSRQIFVKVSNTKVHSNQSNGSRNNTCGQTDAHT